MSMKTYKILLWGLTVTWATASFVFFGHKLLNQATFGEAKSSVELTQTFFEEYSKQIKFKLGQWSYNYQLKSNKGVEFDHAAFMEAEFDLIGFYTATADESMPYEKQWMKSKDFAANDLPEALVKRIQSMSFETVKTSPYVWMAGLDESGQSVVMMVTAVEDAAVGSGILVGSLDLEFIPYKKINSNVLVVDAEGRYLLNSQKEYLAQKASSIIKQMPNGELQTNDGEAWLVSRHNGYDYVYRAEQKGLVGVIGWPLLLMLLGLGFLVALPMFLQDEPEAFEDVAAYEPTSKTAEQSEIDFAGYESVLKVQSLRDKLNKMSLISSSLKGRLDLVTLGELDQRLLKDITADFNLLDKSIDDAFNEASEFGGQEDLQPQTATAFAIPSLADVKTPVVAEERSEVDTEKPTPDATSITAAPVMSAPVMKAEPVSQASGKTVKTDAFAFEIQEDDIDADFVASLSLSPVEKESKEIIAEEHVISEESHVTDIDAKASNNVVKVPVNQYSSQLVSESLEEAKFAFGNFAEDGELTEDDLFGDLNDLEEIEVVATEDISKEFKAAASLKNDWSKVIEELTEELNNLDLDLSEIEMDEAEEEFQEAKQTVKADPIKPPRIEL